MKKSRKVKVTKIHGRGQNVACPWILESMAKHFALISVEPYDLEIKKVFIIEKEKEQV